MSRINLLRHLVSTTSFGGGGGGGGTVYDLSMGSAVDTNGYTTLPLRAGAIRYFVGSGGSDSNTGLSHAQRFATILKAFDMCVSGNGDQILISEGWTTVQTLPKGGDYTSWLASKSGFSPTYPLVISTYDPADPLTEAKYGMGHIRSARPKLTAAMGQLGGSGNYLAVKGIDFDTGTGAGQGSGLVGTNSYILFENCIFRYNGLTITDGGDGVSAPVCSHFIMRNCSIYGCWTDTTANVGNLYVQSYDYVTVEDCVNYHSGWRIGASRDDSVASAANGGSGLGGGPTYFRHGMYAQANCNHITVRRNLFMDGAGDGASLRGTNIDFSENVTLRCPAGTGFGPSNTVEFGAYPSGVQVDAGHNLTMEGIDVNSTQPSGYCYSLQGTTSTSRVHHNLSINNLASTTNANAIALTGGTAYSLPARSTNIIYENNVSKNWNLSTQTHIESSTPTNFTGNSNVWDSPASGTNTNWSTSTFPNAYTAAALYTAAGVTDYATLATLAINAPEQHYQRTIRSLAFAGYGVV